MDDDVPIELVPRLLGRDGRAIVTARQGDQALHTELLNLARADHRDRFAQEAERRYPGLDYGDVLDRLDEAAGSLVDAAAEGGDAARLVALARDFELFRTPDPEPAGYARIPVGDHRETVAVDAPAFRDRLVREFYRESGGVPAEKAVREALALLSARARFDGPAIEVAVRLARRDDRIYLDLADDLWRVVEVDPSGFRVVADPPVRFRRPGGMLPLPVPRRGDGLGRLRGLLNLRDDRQWALVLGWLVGCFAGRGPFFILVLLGQQGSAKSTLSWLLRSLADPNVAALRSLPRDEEALLLQARNGLVVALDNVSRIPDWLSDALCRLATGGGISRRRLYHDDAETIWSACGPVLINAITPVADRPDLLDRMIVLNLPPIPGGCRRTAREVRREFEEARPEILGALLAAVALALRDQDGVVLDDPPRMADACVWIRAAEPALGLGPGEFLEAYRRNRADAVDQLVLDAPIGPALDALVRRERAWVGTSKQLLERLGREADAMTTGLPEWPRSPKQLSNDLRRLAPPLREWGVRIEFPTETTRRGHNRDRLLRLEWCPEAPPAPPAAPQTLAAERAGCGRTLDRPSGPPGGTGERGAGPADGPHQHRPRPSPETTGTCDAAGGADGAGRGPAGEVPRPGATWEEGYL